MSHVRTRDCKKRRLQLQVELLPVLLLLTVFGRCQLLHTPSLAAAPLVYPLSSLTTSPPFLFSAGPPSNPLHPSSSSLPPPML